MAMTPTFAVRGGEYDIKMCNIRIDGASGICDGECPSARINQETQTREIVPTFP